MCNRARGELAIRSWELKGQKLGSSSLVSRVSPFLTPFSKRERGKKKERDRGGGKGRGLFLSPILNKILKEFIITPKVIKKKIPQANGVEFGGWRSEVGHPPSNNWFVRAPHQGSYYINTILLQLNLILAGNRLNNSPGSNFCLLILKAEYREMR